MRVGQIVTNLTTPAIYGVVIGLDPYKDGEHTQIFWADSDEKDSWIISVWENTNFRVIGTALSTVLPITGDIPANFYEVHNRCVIYPDFCSDWANKQRRTL